MISIAVQESLNLLAVRRAVAVAIDSVEDSLFHDDHDLSMGELVRLHKEKTALEDMLLATQNLLLDQLTMEITHDEKVSILFYLSDADAGGNIDAYELEKVLRRLNNKLGSDAVAVAEKTIEVFAGSNKTFLDEDHFDVFLQHLAKTMNCSFHNLCLLLVTRLAFNVTGKEILTGATRMSSEEVDQDLLQEVRTFLTFEMIDFLQEGNVSSDVVLRYTSSITKDPIKAKRLLARFANEGDNYGTMGYPGFCDYVQELAGAFFIDYTYVLRAITLAVGRQAVSGKGAREVFLDSNAYQDAINCEVDTLSEDDEIQEYGKLKRLYDLLDCDHDGSLDIAELALFLRRFQEGKDIDKTISESIHAMLAADADGDNRLDKKEFIQLIKKLSSGSGVEIHRFINFLIVETALKDVSTNEKYYIAQLKASGSTSKGGSAKHARHQMLPLKLGKMLLMGLRQQQRNPTAPSSA